MVTAVFSAIKGLELKLPADQEGETHPEPAVLIHVQDDRVVVDCREMAKEEILPYLEPKLLRNPDKPVILYTDSEARYGRMIPVYDLLAETVRNVAVPTRSDIAEYEELFGFNPLERSCP